MNKESLIAHFEVEYGHPDFNYEVKAEQEKFSIIGLLPLPDEEIFETSIMTVGLSLLQKQQAKYELLFDIVGDYSDTDRVKLGTFLARLGQYLIKEKKVLKPFLVLEKPSIHLPFYKNTSYLLVAHWGKNDSKFLDVEQIVSMFEIIPLSEEEAKKFNRIPTENKETVLILASKELSDIDRSSLDFLEVAIRNVWVKIQHWYKENSKRLFENLKGGISSEEVMDAENKMNRKFPVELLHSLSTHNGDMDYYDSYKYFTGEEIASYHAMMNEILDEGGFKHKPLVPTKGIVQDSWWDREWIPFACDSVGNLLCIDMNPGEKGIKGQIIYWEKIEGPIYAGFTSFFDWLNDYLQGLWRGRFELDEEGFLSEK